MVIELTRNNLTTEIEKSFRVYYNDQVVGDFYVDLFVQDEIIARPARLNSRWRTGGTKISAELAKTT